MRYCFMVIVLVPRLVFPGTETQSDWSGGPGEQGPFTQWTSTFLESNDLSWKGIPGKLLLALQLVDPVRYEIDVADGANCIIPADIDGDGDQDILASRSFYDSSICWYENTEGSPSSLVRHFITGFQAVMCGSCDIDGDGDMDVYSGSPSSGFHEVRWWENEDGSGTQWTEHTVLDAPSEISFVSHADLDNDGDNDLAVSCSYPSALLWLDNSGGTGSVWIEHSINIPFNSNSEINRIMPSDMNNDGWIDILTATEDSLSVVWFENESPSLPWSHHTICSCTQEAYDVSCADIDGDGMQDVVVADGALGWWRNQAGGTIWLENPVDDTLTSVTCTWCCDVDLDGDSDLIGGSLFDHKVSIWTNDDGCGSEWSTHEVDQEFWGCIFLSDIDLDSNGSKELLGAAFILDSFSLWTVGEFRPSGQLTSSVLDLQEDPQWASLSWDHCSPPGSSIEFQYRSSMDPGDMGQWSSPVTEPSVIDGLHRYFQYRALLETEDQGVSPYLDYVCISWDPSGGLGPITGETVSVSPLRNPSDPQAAGLRVSAPAGTWGNLAIYDLSGRMISGMDLEFQDGTLMIFPDRMCPGLYFAVLATESGSCRTPFMLSGGGR